MRKAFVAGIISCFLASMSFGNGSVEKHDPYERCGATSQSMNQIRVCLVTVGKELMTLAFNGLKVELELKNDEEALEALTKSQKLFSQYLVETCNVVREMYSDTGWVADDMVTNCYTELLDQRISILERDWLHY